MILYIARNNFGQKIISRNAREHVSQNLEAFDGDDSLRITDKAKAASAAQIKLKRGFPLSLSLFFAHAIRIVSNRLMRPLCAVRAEAHTTTRNAHVLSRFADDSSACQMTPSNRAGSTTVPRAHTTNREHSGARVAPKGGPKKKGGGEERMGTLCVARLDARRVPVACLQRAFQDSSGIFSGIVARPGPGLVFSVLKTQSRCERWCERARFEIEI